MDNSYLQSPAFKALQEEMNRFQKIISIVSKSIQSELRPTQLQLQSYQRSIDSIKRLMTPTFETIRRNNEILAKTMIPAETLRSLSNRYSDLFKDFSYRVNMPAIENLNRMNRSLTETLAKTLKAYSAQPADIFKIHIPDISNNIDTDYADLNWDQDSPDEFCSFDEQTLTQIEESIGTLPSECKQTDDSGKTLVPQNIIKSIIFYIVNLLTLLSFALDVYNSYHDSSYQTEMLEKVDTANEFLQDISQQEQHQSQSVEELDDRLDNQEESIRKLQDTVELLLNSLEDEP